jgi:hypothetical protein
MARGLEWSRQHLPCDMTPDQQAGSDAESQDSRDASDRDRGAEHEEARARDAGRQGGREGEGERDLREDVKELPGAMRQDARGLYRGADKSIAQRMEERPVFERALDLRIVLASLVIAFVLALVLRLIGLSPGLSIFVFLIALAGLWLGLARFYASRGSRSQAASERESRGGDDEAAAGDQDG